MIVTTTILNDFRVQLGGHLVDGLPKLVFINWIADDAPWYQAKSLDKLTKHYQITPANIQFIEQDSLSKSDAIQTLLLSTIKQLQDYAAGQQQSFDLSLDMTVGTPFQQQVWQALQSIPYGETISYADLAKTIGKPTAYRAVANANGRNPFSIVVPCHRVIASGGSLGGYTGGLDKKQFLLEIES